MAFLSIFDVIGPVMIGPSSSHTAGAAKIGFEMNKICEGKIVRAEFFLFNSFADTCEGHGTKIALLGGLLGFSPENNSIKNSFEIAKNNGVKFSFKKLHNSEKHPNSVLIKVKTLRGNFSGFGESLGGGLINFKQVFFGESENA